MANKAGNVGGVVIKITIDNNNLCFINCNLPGGKADKKLLERIEIINEIHSKSF
jgi:hypothetical protein